MTVTSAPMRSAVRAESMAALPPPMTTTFRPSRTGSSLRDRFQEEQRRHDALQLGAGQIDPGFLPGADGEEDGVVLVVQIVQRDVRAHRDVADELHAQRAGSARSRVPARAFGSRYSGSA